MAFPAISTGVFGYPMEPAAEADRTFFGAPEIVPPVASPAVGRAPRTVRHRPGLSGALLLAGALILAGCTSSTVTAARVHHLRTTTSAPNTSTTRPRPRATTTTVPATTSTSEPATTTPATAPPTTAVPTAFTTTPTAPAAPPPPLAQPTAAHPLTVLEIGDSLGVDLGLGMADVFASDPYVHLVQAAVSDTGLARPDYYNWPAHLSQELSAYHPGVVVVMLGGNDGQDFVDGGTYVSFGSPLWHTIYSERVGNLMNEAMTAGAHVFWVGMPIMAAAGLSEEMALEDEAYSQQAALRSGVTYFSSWNVFTNSAGQYAQYLPDQSGQLAMVRYSDGVHLTSAGATRLASAMVAPMEAALGVTLRG